MSKVFVFSIPASGHVNPTLPLVKALVDLGEHVVYYCSDTFSDRIRNTGAEFRTLGTRHDTRVSDMPKNVFSIFRLGIEGSREVTPRVVREIERDKPDYVICDLMPVFGRVIRKTLKIPTVVSVPVFVLSDGMLRHLPLRLRAGLGLMAVSAPVDLLRFARAARWFQKRFGLKWSDLLSLDECYSEFNIVYTSTFFQSLPVPAGKHFQFIGPTIYADRESRDDLLNLPDHRKVLYISLGTAFGRRPLFYRLCFQAFGSTDLHVVLSVGSRIDPGDLGPIPTNFTVRSHVPQLHVLKNAAAFITHGGMNSTAEALMYNVPLVVFPQAVDQFLVALRIEELGAGIRLIDVTVPSLRRAVNRVMTETTFKHQAEIIADSFRRSGGAEAGARAILDAVGGQYFRHRGSGAR